MTPTTRQRGPGRVPYVRYLATIAFTVAGLMALVLTVNFLVDPLWYFEGNRITGKNARYNERYSKINLFLKNPGKYDCVILGSSTTTLINPDLIKGFTCFNLSFSRGHIKEYIDFLRYTDQYTRDLKLVVVGFDTYNFLANPLGADDDHAPQFVRDHTARPRPFQSYLALETFAASVKALLNIVDNGGYYDRDFKAVMVGGHDPYDPNTEAFNDDFQQRFHHAIGQFGITNLRYVEELRAVAGNARIVGFTPPIAAHYIGYLRLRNELDNYLHALYRTSALFDDFYDFTMPSKITEDPDNTIDGMHYSQPVNDKIALTLAGGTLDFGAMPNELNFADYRRQFYHATDTFLSDLKFITDAGNTCAHQGLRGVRRNSCR